MGFKLPFVDFGSNGSNGTHVFLIDQILKHFIFLNNFSFQLPESSFQFSILGLILVGMNLLFLGFFPETLFLGLYFPWPQFWYVNVWVFGSKSWTLL